MATCLHRLAHLCFRARKSVLAGWLALLIAAVGLAAAFHGTTSNEFRVPGTEAQSTLDRIKGTFPDQGHGSAQVVFAAPADGGIDAAQAKAAVSQAVARIAQVPGVSAVPDPYATGALSPNGRVALGLVSFATPLAGVTDQQRQAVKAAAEPAGAAGLTVEFGGDAYTKLAQVDSNEVAGLLVAALTLVIALGSLVAAGLPLLSALFGIGIAMAGLLALTGPFSVIATAPVLALMVGLAVGIDYALFIVSRYRRNLAEGLPPAEAAARANATAGSAVVFAGLTVVVALAGLAVAGVPFLTQMGLAASGAVAAAVLVAITLLPALLGFAGRSIDRLPLWRRALRPPAGTAMGERWARFVVRRPVAVLVGGLLVLGALAVPAASLSLGLPGAGSQAADTDARKAYDLVSDNFGPGFNAPLVVVVDAAKSPDPAAAVQQVAQRLSALPDVATLLPPRLDQPSRTALVGVIPRSGPDTDATRALVGGIRAQRGAIEAGTAARIDVTGTTAANIDVSRKLDDALVPFVAVIAGIALLLLTVAFRSLLVPLKAVLGFLLSVLASLGAVVAVYQWGWLSGLIDVPRVGPVVSFVPILLIGVLFGLAMDYELFLVSGMKEAHAHGAAAKEAVVAGTRNGARVVTAAALIMISVFGSFVTGHDPIVQPIGFALAVGVLVDAFVVRMALVPAAMALFGRAAWWLPEPLRKVLPEVDMEGEQLLKRLADAGAAENAGPRRAPVA
ncbi:MMPL family transporter [Kitasatospora viridis]|uniref:RND superfamily putative drug exporter n=1 Tax=Kitasatospora viridis TaxID=281105 RepID=A0A561SDP5_9ACTN|nr:MMPL family transporter [Kitasatospora viridis]TWF72989.1 RND superfamily putative drug exporter [Kitasatospora viridis]